MVGRGENLTVGTVRRWWSGGPWPDVRSPCENSRDGTGNIDHCRVWHLKQSPGGGWDWSGLGRVIRPRAALRAHRPLPAHCTRLWRQVDAPERQAMAWFLNVSRQTGQGSGVGSRGMPIHQQATARSSAGARKEPRATEGTAESQALEKGVAWHLILSLSLLELDDKTLVWAD